MAEVWECLLMKLTADQYYFVYFCMFEEPAMFKPLSYSSVFVSVSAFNHRWESYQMPHSAKIVPAIFELLAPPQQVHPRHIYATAVSALPRNRSKWIVHAIAASALWTRIYARLMYSETSAYTLICVSTDNASFNAKNIRASSPDLFMSMPITVRASCFRFAARAKQSRQVENRL